MNESAPASEAPETDGVVASIPKESERVDTSAKEPQSSTHTDETNFQSDPSLMDEDADAHQQNTTQTSIEVESDSEVEDVTDLYVQRKRAASSSPEVIEVEDVSSDDEEDNRNLHSGNSNESKSFVEAHCDGKSSYSHGAPKKEEETHDDNDNESNSDEESDSSSSDSDIQDVTEFMLAKKKEQLLKEMDGAIELESDSEEDEDGLTQKTTSSSRPRKRRRVLQSSPIEVLLDGKDVPSCPGQKCSINDDDQDTTKSNKENDESQPSENNVDHTIKQRIIKLLNTGFHSESNENEAKNAMKLARRLMERYNLDQSVLLRERGDGSLNDFSTTNDADFGGGIVSVSIQHRKKGKALKVVPRWLDFLVQPICANFHVDAFKTLNRATQYREGECTISFYGIRTNAQLAAYAYKVASESISLMSANFYPVATMSQKKLHVKNARLSYALGIVIGLDRSVTQELRKEEERRKTRLNKARKAAHGDACDESDDGNNSTLDDEDGDDVEHPIDLTLDQLEDENAAQLALIDHQKKIAETVLKVSRSL